MTDPRYSIIPGGAVTDPRIKGRDLQVLCLFGRHTDKKGWCRRSQVKMATEIGCARSTVQASIERLVAAGWLEKRILSTPHEAGQRDSAHEYRVVIDGRDDAQDVVGTPADQSAPLPTQDRHPLPTHGSAPINDPSLTSSLRDDGARERFASLWAIFPRRPGQSRKTALKAYLALSDRDQKACDRAGPLYAAKFEGNRLAKRETLERALGFMPALVRWIEAEGWTEFETAVEPAIGVVTVNPGTPDFDAVMRFMGGRVTPSKSGRLTVRAAELEQARAVA